MIRRELGDHSRSTDCSNTGGKPPVIRPNWRSNQYHYSEFQYRRKTSCDTTFDAGEVEFRDVPIQEENLL